MAPPVLTLVAEHKVSAFIRPPKGSAVLEASGVIQKDGDYYVVFDNIRRLARIRGGLALESSEHGWVGPIRDGEGYEDLAFNPKSGHFYLLIEAEKHPDGTYKPLIDECDQHGRFRKRRWVDVSFDRRNTGMEGLAAVRWQERDYLLGLCEGNGGHGGRKGKKRGHGLIHVLRRKGTVWQSVATINLPPSVKFEDYSAVTLRGRTIAVLSQQTSRLWIGTLRFSDWTITGPGTIYDFPRSRKGKIRYCTLEGVSWCSPNTLVMVSDLVKPHYARRCRKHDQSIHLFRLPKAPARATARRAS
ncbi:MAG: hypothetical protein Q8O42_16740 [Acidobacteriota bacterium]|nr:hypothetical protein [Acidobacteriota bacterium]